MRRLLLLSLAAMALGASLATALRPEERHGAPARKSAPEVAPAEVQAPASPATEASTKTTVAAIAPAATTAVAEAAPTAPPPERALPPDQREQIERLLASDPRTLDPKARAELELRLADLSRSMKGAALRSGERDAHSQVATPPAPPPPPKPAPHAVLGRVRDAEGAPVADALVTAYAWGEQRAQDPARTDAAGTFTLAHNAISDGRPHRVVVEHRRYRPRELGIPPRKPEDEPTPLDVALEDGPALAGVVRLPSGAPAEGAEVTVIGLAAATRTDRDGRFSLPVLPPGRHLVVARVAEQRLAALATSTIDADGFPPDARPLALLLGAEGTIAGSGLEKLTPNVGPARVELWVGARTPQGPAPLQGAQAGPDGVVRFEALPPGAYTVALSLPSIGYLTPEPVAVTLAAGALREVWLGRSGSAVIRLAARGAGGIPERSVFSAWGDLGGSAAVISANGEARLEGMPADRYFVFCNDQKGGLGRGSVRVAAGEVASLDLTLVAAGRAVGSVVDEAGRPATGARVTSDTEEGRIAREAVVDADGKFALEMLYPGRHVLRARLDGRTAERTITVGVGEVVGPLGIILGALPDAPSTVK